MCPQPTPPVILKARCKGNMCFQDNTFNTVSRCLSFTYLTENVGWGVAMWRNNAYQPSLRVSYINPQQYRGVLYQLSYKSHTDPDRTRTCDHPITLYNCFGCSSLYYTYRYLAILAVLLVEARGVEPPSKQSSKS